jgi:hypothetical protein
MELDFRRFLPNPGEADPNLDMKLYWVSLFGLSHPDGSAPKRLKSDEQGVPSEEV